MIELIREFYIQIITIAFMTVVIITAIVLGQKTRKMVDKKKQNSVKENTERTEDAE